MRTLGWVITGLSIVWGFCLIAADITPDDRYKTDYTTSWTGNTEQTYGIGARAVGCSFNTKKTAASGGATLKTNQSDLATAEKNITHTEYPNTSDFGFSVHGTLAGAGSGGEVTWSATLEQKFFWLDPIEKLVKEGTSFSISANGPPTEST